MEKEAEEFYKKSLAILEETLGERHPSIAVNYGNLAVLYKNQGKLTEAEESFANQIILHSIRCSAFINCLADTKKILPN